MIFVTDLDKTLLRSDLSLSEFTKNTWNSFPFSLTIATARSFKGSTTLLNGLNLKHPLVLLDGAMIASPEGKIIKINDIDKKTGDEVINIIEKEFDERPLIVGFENFGDEKFLYPKKINKYQEELLQNYKNDSRVLNIENLRALKHNLKMVYLGEEDVLKRIEKKVKELFNLETKLSKDPYMECWFLTLLHPLGDKAHALMELEEIMQVDKKNVTVFGDSLNDIGMFEYAGKSVAVKNALDEVKKRADIILPHTNDEDAVAKYLSEYIN
ncbi:hydrolase [Nautilia sp. PV-1]|uniref:HAD-IIB family hydrolase n=1 Tax=Nautilia sp. PV-1 TaxID=2579250 RepID=UPI000FDA7C7D|nr:HAD-IIB family hydrolase [Nautilia sp. PV-1]AZV47218.1 hydrolase [Nautilia sp. PV-1]